MSECLKKRGFKVEGFDLNKDAIELAKRSSKDIFFFVGDASKPKGFLKNKKYDLILFRESHLFSRIDNFEFQTKILKLYLESLNKNGSLVIGHGRRGGNMNYPNFSFKLCKRWLKKPKYEYIGPYYFFLLKRFNFLEKNKFLIIIQSYFSKIISILFNKRLIEYYIIIKK